MEIERLKMYIQSANINFLFGSGLSVPYLETLGDIEKLLTELSESEFDVDVKAIIKASIYRDYFSKIIFPNRTITKRTKYLQVIKNYAYFLSIWNDIFNKRANKLLSKQINIDTTNIDTFIEKENNTIAYLNKVSVKSFPILSTGVCIIAGQLAEMPIVVQIDRIEDTYKPQNETIDIVSKWIND